MILQATRVLDACVDLAMLHIGFSANYWRLHRDIDLLKTLFVRPNEKKPGQKLKSFTALIKFNNNWSLGNSFYCSIPIFQNLDCLSLVDKNCTNAHLRNELRRCRSLRIRKFQLSANRWNDAREIIGNGQLELLHILLRRPGLNYEDLIPLVVKSSNKLQVLRLELKESEDTQGCKQVLSHDMANQLVMKCSKLRHLFLHADFEAGVWVRDE
jgi:hypothetical protein